MSSPMRRPRGAVPVLAAVAASLSLSLTAGCQSSASAESSPPREPVEREQVQVSVSGATATREGDTLTIDYPVLRDKNDRVPDWVMNPSLGGVIGAIGVASQRALGTREQLDEARRDARLELAAMLEARVQGVGREELQENTDVNGGERRENAAKNNLRVGRDILDVVLAGSRQRALWFDPDNGECYVWIVLDGRVLQSVNHSVVDSVSVFVASTPITNEYRPERRKPEKPTVIVESPDRPAPAPEPEQPKTPVEELEGNLKPIQTIPLKKDPAGGKGGGG